MGSNSALRVVAKRILRPLTTDAVYSRVQTLAMAWDIRQGNWKEPELKLIPHALRSGESALDIGANYGLYCYHLSRAVGSSGKVFAFEPIPFTFGVLSRVCKLLRLKNVRLFLHGCSNTAGEVEFTVPLQDSGGVSAGQAHIGTRQDDHAGKESQVRWKATRSVRASLIKLDDFTRDLELGELALIKCDTEGAELMVFEGAAGLLKRFKPTVILEINPWFMEGFGKRVEQLVELFQRHGYQMYRLADGEEPSLHPVAADKVVEDNYIFIHPRFKERFSGIE
jgi:FkbM family methyltransferase